MIQDRIDKTVYTKNSDGTVEKWYLECIYNNDSAILRKSARPKWHDITRCFLLCGVYETKREALKSKYTSKYSKI